jgi:hypothetical protein
MKNVTPDQRTMLTTWQQHTYAEFVLKDADAALATMTENPHVLLIGSGVVRVGRAAVREFYADKFLPTSRRISKSPLYRRLSAMIASSKRWRYVLPIRSIWIGSSRGYGPPAERPNSWSPFSSNSMAAKSRTSMLTGIRQRCCLSWASWIIHWRWVECAVRRSETMFSLSSKT